MPRRKIPEWLAQNSLSISTRYCSRRARKLKTPVWMTIPCRSWRDLSQQTKDDIPTLYYQRHDYSSDTNLSSIVLNGTTVKAGGSPLPGMKVEEILPDSVVLNYRGTQFRLRALNSWINL